MPEIPALGELGQEDQKSGASLLDLTSKTFLKINGTGDGTQWNACLLHSKPWVQFSAQIKTGCGDTLL